MALTQARESQLNARKQLALYLALIVASSAVIDTVIIHRQGYAPWWYLVMMWSPAASALVCRIVFRLGVKDISLRLGGRRGASALLIAWLFPLVVAALAYGLAWRLGLASFFGEKQRFWSSFGWGISAITLWSAVSATGEELGWRGFMLTRLVDAGLPAPKILSGLIWAAWHLPIILGGAYMVGPSWTSIVVFVVCIVAIAVAMADMRLASGSVWPAVMLHAAWNADTQFIFDPATSGGERWLGEGGLLVAGFSIAGALLVRMYYKRNLS